MTPPQFQPLHILEYIQLVLNFGNNNFIFKTNDSFLLQKLKEPEGCLHGMSGFENKIKVVIQGSIFGS